MRQTVDRTPGLRIERTVGVERSPAGLYMLGRREECAVVDRLLEGAKAGRSGALVMLGKAGVGKTALLDYAMGSADGMHGLRAVSVESEMELPFAALHQLCAPLLERLERLPGPQRTALQITFGLSGGAVPDRFLVSLAVLSLLAEMARAGPLACVIDDAQWLDAASAQVLAFATRRMEAEPIVMLFASRKPRDEFQELPALVVRGLREADARLLLRSTIPGRLDDRVADRIIAEVRGNPLALLELPRGMTMSQLAGGFGLPQLSLETRIEKHFSERQLALPEDSQRLLLIAAAEPMGDPALLWRAAELLGITGSSLEPVESAGLIQIGRRVRFRHPLVRSAIYHAATSQERRLVHGALASATDAQVDPDRRAWHLAEATLGADENVASELEAAAGRAHARGGLAAAAAFLERAASLTPEPSLHAERTLRAAHTKYEAGALDDAVELLATADAGSGDESHRARVDLLRGRIAFAARRGGDAPSLLLKAARELETVDPAAARATYLEALSAGRFAGRLAQGVTLVEISEAALAGPPPAQPLRPPDLLLEGLATRFTRGYAAAAPILKRALGAFRSERSLRLQEARWLLLACRVASDLWDDESLTLLSARELERCRNSGALSAISLALDARSWTHALSGELAEAAWLLDEARVITEAAGVPTAPYAPLWLAALRGEESDFLEIVEATAKPAASRGEGFALAITGLVSAVLYNGLGQYDAALAACRGIVARSDLPGAPRGPESELIEASVRCGELLGAERALGRLAVTARASGTDWALGIEAQSRALLEDGDAAESLYREAIARLGRTRVRVQLARCHLLYGEWLRRRRRRVEARQQLRAAHEMFLAMGTEAFARRAERELLATGEHVRKRTGETQHELTAQEAQIARFAQEGLSNAEIGARLFISQHTVAYHLRNVFAKLGIASRHQLENALLEHEKRERTPLLGGHNKAGTGGGLRRPTSVTLARRDR